MAFHERPLVTDVRPIPGRHQIADRRHVMGRMPSQEHGLPVDLDGDAIEFDGPVDGVVRERQKTLLQGIAEHEEIGGDAVAEQASGEMRGIDDVDRRTADRLLKRLFKGRKRILEIGVEGKGTGHRLLGVNDGRGRAGSQLAKRVRRRRRDHVAGQQQAGPAVGDPRCVELTGRAGDADVTDHGAPFLGHADHVEHRDTVACDMGRHAKERARP